MLLAPASPPSPLPTPTATLPSIHGAIQLQPRQTDIYGGYYTYTGYGGYDCFDVNKAGKCVNILTRCYTGGNAFATDLSAATSCLCTHGISYLDCFFSNVATGTCATYYLGGIDWNQYQMSYYTSICGSIPPSVMAQMKPPETVSLSLIAVDVVTVDGTLGTPDYDGRPKYDGTGALLNGDCSQTDFTLVDAGQTVFYGGFVGCIKDKPECCPWPVATSAIGGIAAAQTETANGGDKIGNLGFDYPQPLVKKDMELDKCATDYYSISGGCCPVGFWPFTAMVGGQTPCWSSIGVNVVIPPTLTVAKEAELTRIQKDKSTSAVVNIVWAMRYPVKSQSSGLSTAAKAGIGAGAGIAAILIAGLAVCLWLSRRKNRKLKQEQEQQQAPNSTVEQVQAGGPLQQEGVLYQNQNQNQKEGYYAPPPPQYAPPGQEIQYQAPGQAVQYQAPGQAAVVEYHGTPSPLQSHGQQTPSTLVPQQTANSTVSELTSSQSVYYAQSGVSGGGGGYQSPAPPQPGQYSGHPPIAEAPNEVQVYGYPQQQHQQHQLQHQHQQSGAMYAVPVNAQEGGGYFQGQGYAQGNQGP